MNYKSLDRKQRYGIRKFAVGAASVVIGTVVFGTNPVLAQEQANAAGANTETVEPGQGLSELPKKCPREILLIWIRIWLINWQQLKTTALWWTKII